MDNNQESAIKRGIRKSYRREEKLAAVKHYYDVGKNLYAVGRKFGVDRRMVRRWVKQEEKLVVSINM